MPRISAIPLTPFYARCGDAGKVFTMTKHHARKKYIRSIQEALGCSYTDAKLIADGTPALRTLVSTALRMRPDRIVVGTITSNALHLKVDMIGDERVVTVEDAQLPEEINANAIITDILKDFETKDFERYVVGEISEQNASLLRSSSVLDGNTLFMGQTPDVFTLKSGTLTVITGKTNSGKTTLAHDLVLRNPNAVLMDEIMVYTEEAERKLYSTLQEQPVILVLHARSELSAEQVARIASRGNERVLPVISSHLGLILHTEREKVTIVS